MISYIQIQGGPFGPGTVSSDTEIRSTSTHYMVYFILIQGPLTANNNDQELTALRAEVERLEIASQESLLAQQSKHNGELADIRGQFDESERRIRAYEMDVQVRKRNGMGPMWVWFRNYKSFLAFLVHFHLSNMFWRKLSAIRSFRRFCKQFSESSPCLPGQQGSCITAVELSENILRNLGNDLMADSVLFCLE